MKKGGIRFYLGLAVLAAGIASLTGCSGSSDNNAVSGQDRLMTDTASNSGSASSAASSASTADQAVASNDANANSAGEEAKAETAAGSGNGSTQTTSTGVLGGTADEAGFSRKLIYRANLAMQVEDYAKAQSLISNAIALSGGYIVQFSDQQTSYELGGTYTIKVPANGFMSFLAGIENIQHVAIEKKLTGTDVTEEYVDLEARLKARQVVEARLLNFMEKAVKADDLLKFSKELGDVQTEIERIKGRMRYLDQNVAFSTVELRVYQQSVTPIEKKSEPAGFAKQVMDAWNGSLSFIRDVAQGTVIALAAIVPVLVLLVIIVLLVYFLFWRRRALISKKAKEGQVDKQTALTKEAPIVRDPADESDETMK